MSLHPVQGGAAGAAETAPANPSKREIELFWEGIAAAAIEEIGRQFWQKPYHKICHESEVYDGENDQHSFMFYPDVSPQYFPGKKQEPGAAFNLTKIQHFVQNELPRQAPPSDDERKLMQKTAKVATAIIKNNLHPDDTLKGAFACKALLKAEGVKHLGNSVYFQYLALGIIRQERAQEPAVYFETSSGCVIQ